VNESFARSRSKPGAVLVVPGGAEIGVVFPLAGNNLSAITRQSTGDRKSDDARADDETFNRVHPSGLLIKPEKAGLDETQGARSSGKWVRFAKWSL
jgi:hypothetical protein